MSETATITKLGTPREWTGTNGTMFFTDVILSDGVAISLGRKTANSIKAGDSVTYNIDANGKAKEVRQNSGNRSTFQRGSSASFALSYSKDLTAALITAGKTNGANSIEIADMTIKIAEKFNAWLRANE